MYLHFLHLRSLTKFHITSALCFTVEYDRKISLISLSREQAVILIIPCLPFWIRACLSLPRARTVDGKVLAWGPLCSFSCEVCTCGAYLADAVQDQPLTLKSEPSPLGVEASCSWAREQKVRGHNQGKCVCVCLLHVFSFMQCTHIFEHYFHICMCETLPFSIKRLYELDRQNVTTLRPILRHATVWTKSSGTE